MRAASRADARARTRRPRPPDAQVAPGTESAARLVSRLQAGDRDLHRSARSQFRDANDLSPPPPLSAAAAGGAGGDIRLSAAYRLRRHQDSGAGRSGRPRGATARWRLDRRSPRLGSFVFNLADTSNRFVSTPHRVVNCVGRDRYSLAYFFDTGMDAVIEWRPSCFDAALPARHAPARSSDYLIERLEKNDDYRRSGVVAAGRS
jgi:hypothetical protein